MANKLSEGPSLAAIAEHVPMGYECRSCGGSAYNWLAKCHRYVERGETCCANMREWVKAAEAGKQTVRERMDERQRSREAGHLALQEAGQSQALAQEGRENG